MSPAAGVRAVDGGVEIAVVVKPRASRTELIGVRAGAYEIRLAAPPVDDAANDELVRFLAKALGVPRSAVEIARGERSKHKGVRVRGLAPSDAEILLAAPESRTERAAKGRLDGS